jgi:hypothetical protein
MLYPLEILMMRCIQGMDEDGAGSLGGRLVGPPHLGKWRGCFVFISLGSSSLCCLALILAHEQVSIVVTLFM